MLPALTLLLVCQLLGEIVIRALSLPVPGPVLGMFFLFLFLLLRDGPSTELRTTAQALLQHLSLLFVPAGTGVVLYLRLIQEEWLAISVALCVSTLLAMLVSAAVMRLAQGESARRGLDAAFMERPCSAAQAIEKSAGSVA